MYKKVTFNLDESDSIKQTIRGITKDWFNVDNLFEYLKNKGRINSAGFWLECPGLIQDTSEYLSLSIDDFLIKWRSRCDNMKINIAAFHCTRTPDPESFLKNGIKPLDKSQIQDFYKNAGIAFPDLRLDMKQKEIITKAICDEDQWKIREGNGPCFYISLKWAIKSGNTYLKVGSEVMLLYIKVLIDYCKKMHIKIPCYDQEEFKHKLANISNPIIFYCEFPYSILPDHKYESMTRFMLGSFFEVLNGENISSQYKEAGIDLKGNCLPPKYIYDFDVI